MDRDDELSAMIIEVAGLAVVYTVSHPELPSANTLLAFALRVIVTCCPGCTGRRAGSCSYFIDIDGHYASLQFPAFSDGALPEFLLGLGALPTFAPVWSSKIRPMP